MPAFEDNEIVEALKAIKSGKSPDNKGLLAEMLKQGGTKLRRILLQLMNSIIQPGAPAPEEWRESTFKVLFKGGDMKHAKNYRPICVLPLLYKLFSTMLYRRLQPSLDKELPKDQAGFRKKFGTVDHLHAFAQIQEKTSEWNVELWTCFLDFQKAFDSVEHAAIWQALERQGVNNAYIEVLKRLYTSQVGMVTIATKTSRRFALERGTKQGDPLSTLLFNAVLEDVFRDVRSKWKTRKYGLEMSIGAEEWLTALNFADDVVLLASKDKDLKVMMRDLMEAAARRGLVAHDGKTKVLTNADVTSSKKMPTHFEMDGREFEVMGSMSSTKYLGRKIRFHDPNEAEISNRIASAWGAFSKHKE